MGFSFKFFYFIFYYANVTQVDDAIGRILNKLDELGIRKDTIIVYASYYGEFTGELYDEDGKIGIAFLQKLMKPLFVIVKQFLSSSVT